MSTTIRPSGSSENVGRGTLFALLAIVVGIVLLTLLTSIGFVAAITGFAVAFSAVWLYRRGSGGVISRTGAWIVTLIVVVSLLLGYWVSMVVEYARGLTHLGNIGLPGFWPAFFHDFPANFQNDLLYFVLTLAFGLLGSFRILRRAFATARPRNSPAIIFGNEPAAPTQAAGSIQPTTFQNDVAAPPTGSADDKTAPPSSQI